MEQILAFIKDRPQLLEYFPTEEEIPKAGKEWVTNMLQTLLNPKTPKPLLLY